ncbi:UNVERIFIED_CONTAM: hypothetical protein FKN15_029385 [Acipenser sinensis]
MNKEIDCDPTSEKPLMCLHYSTIVGGPADQAGLQQLDTVLQLNGQPVEQWKCVELAHTIRNSHSEITVSVWRTVPQIKPGFESLIRPSNKCNYNPRSPPSKREKNYIRQQVPSEQSQSCHILYNGTDYSSQPAPSEQSWSCHILYNGTDQGSRNGWAQQEQGESKTAHTVQGPRVAVSGDQNYILLAPINPGSQILRPVFQENRGTLGRVYRGRAHGGLQRRSTLIGSTTNMSKTPVHTLKNYADYQNCTVVRSHIPHTSYGTYVTLAPKVLIFPVTVQLWEAVGVPVPGSFSTTSGILSQLWDAAGAPVPGSFSTTSGILSQLWDAAGAPVPGSFCTTSGTLSQLWDTAGSPVPGSFSTTSGILSQLLEAPGAPVPGSFSTTSGVLSTCKDTAGSPVPGSFSTTSVYTTKVSTVTVFIYTDLMLLTREDELGHCNVLQNPLFLQQLKLQEDSSEDLKFYLIHVTESFDGFGSEKLNLCKKAVVVDTRGFPEVIPNEPAIRVPSSCVQ